MSDILRKLCSVGGVSGREEKVRDLIISEIEGYADYKIDALGNLLVHKKGKKPAKNKVMFDAHMDEVGMIVTYLSDDGTLKFSAVGGVDARVYLGRSVKVGDGGVSGVIGLKPIHMLSKEEELDMPKADEMYIDIGASSKEEAQKLVSPGDTVIFDSGLNEFGDGFLQGRALDDRVGCAVMISMIKNELEYDADFSFSVQEEIGTRGAAAAAFNLRPDYAVVLETTTAADIPGVENEKRVCALGEGAVVGFMDKGTIYDRDLYELAFRIAEENNIKIQTKTVVAGGNDAKAIHVSAGGVKTIAVSLPCRYLHSPSCVIKKSDADHVLRLACALLGELADA